MLDGRNQISTAALEELRTRIGDSNPLINMNKRPKSAKLTRPHRRLNPLRLRECACGGGTSFGGNPQWYQLTVKKDTASLDVGSPPKVPHNPLCDPRTEQQFHDASIRDETSWRLSRRSTGALQEGAAACTNWRPAQGRLARSRRTNRKFREAKPMRRGLLQGR